jgi:galactokinase
VEQTFRQTMQEFRTRFEESPAAVVRAPGRVNLIGEHTDYNDGFVLPMAIERGIYIALRPTTDKTVRLYSMDFDLELSFSLEDFARGDDMSPGEYVKGMTRALLNAGFDLTGFEGVVKGDVPIGAGLSSSAAMEMAIGQAFSATGYFSIPAAQMAKYGQWVENVWLGLGSGIMDQMISASGQVGSALLIDCRTLETQPVPLPPDTLIVIMDTGTRRELVGGEYNTRRRQCEEAAAFFGVPKLRDLTLEQFNARAEELDELPRKRARHILTENARVLQARDALLVGDAVTFGALMNASHVSMRDDFEISSPALNEMVSLAQAQAACYGARMTGGGFGGCAVALVKAEDAEAFAHTVAAAYLTATGNSPLLYISQPGGGAEILA